MFPTIHSTTCNSFNSSGLHSVQTVGAGAPPGSSNLTNRLSSARIAPPALALPVTAPALSAVPDQPLSSQVLAALMNLSASNEGATA
jgi:hypothetical protein